MTKLGLEQGTYNLTHSFTTWAKPQGRNWWNVLHGTSSTELLEACTMMINYFLMVYTPNHSIHPRLIQQHNRDKALLAVEY